MADARRAIRIERSRAAEWGIAADRIGIMGFSAGGELAVYSAMDSDTGKKDSPDPSDHAPSRPDFQALIYPERSEEFSVKKGMPPAFFVCGYKDKPGLVQGTSAVFLQYKEVGIPAELHLYTNAAHGF